MPKLTYITNPRVILLAKNEVTLEGKMEMLDYYGDAVQNRDHEPSQAELIEYGGRRCYDASGRKSEKTKTSYGYIGNIMDQNHLSVLEHAHFSFLFEGVSRSLTHEFVRHRHFSYSQESQRYVLSTKHPEVVVPPALLNDPIEIDRFVSSIEEAWELYEDTYAALVDQGHGRKQASEAARAYIPNAAATSIVVSGNARSWMEFIQKRDADGADAEIRRLAGIVGTILGDELPEVFGPRARHRHWNNGAEQKGMKK